jgi:hypothetical protein
MDWEKEFDEIVQRTNYREYTSDRFCCGGDYCIGDHDAFIKSFISSLLSRQKEEVERVIEALKDEPGIYCSGRNGSTDANKLCEYCDVKNATLDKVLAALKNQDKET